MIHQERHGRQQETQDRAHGPHVKELPQSIAIHGYLFTSPSLPGQFVLLFGDRVLLPMPCTLPRCGRAIEKVRFPRRFCLTMLVQYYRLIIVTLTRCVRFLKGSPFFVYMDASADIERRERCWNETP